MKKRKLGKKMNVALESLATSIGASPFTKYKRKFRRKDMRTMAQFERGSMKTFVLNNGSFKKVGEGGVVYKPSRGEILILTFLKSIDVNFIREKSFADCVNPKTNFELRFDFFLPDHNICIEFDGPQHFKKSKKFEDTNRKFKDRLYRDRVKTNYCLRKNITLIRISHKEHKNINNILSPIFKINSSLIKE